MIKKLENGKFQLWAADGSHALGPETSKEAAYRQEVAIWNAQRKEASGPRVEDVTPEMLDNHTPHLGGRERRPARRDAPRRIRRGHHRRREGTGEAKGKK